MHCAGRTHASRARENSTHCAYTASRVHAIAKPFAICLPPSGYSSSTHKAGAFPGSVTGPSGATSCSGGTYRSALGGIPCQPGRGEEPMPRTVTGFPDSQDLRVVIPVNHD